ncbi:MAG: hypothetical protein KC593_20935 [Myxococcales bacterium]|nr:hypothetical protein [Myxococcales bacterium]
MSTNPFERFDLDPEEGPLGITERLRELAEDATSDEERDAVRAAWEQLTRHPRERVRLALSAHPESRPPLPSQQPVSHQTAGGAGPAAPLPDAADFLDPPSVEDALLALLRAAGEEPPSIDRALAPPLDRDPVLMGPPARESNA